MPNVKGSQVVGVIKALRKLRHVAPFDLPAHLERYLDERVVVGAWYPETDMRDLVMLLGTMLNGHVPESVWRYIGRSGAERDFGGIYSALVRPGDTDWTVRQMTRGWHQFRDSGQLSVDVIEPGRTQVVLGEYPVMCPEIAEVNAGYFEGTLAASGAQNPEVETLKSDRSSAHYLLRWTPPDL